MFARNTIALITTMIFLFACSSNNVDKGILFKPLTEENLQGDWASKQGGTPFLRFDKNHIHFLEDSLDYTYIINGDSIRFDFEYATFWYTVKIMEGDSMRFISPQSRDTYYKVKL